MGKTRRNINKKSVMKSIKKSIKNVSTRVLPAVNKGLNVVGATTTNLVKKSAPIIEKGVSTVYGTMTSGFDLGIKGVKGVAKGVKNMSMQTRRKKGGRRRRTRRH
jgi:hypothetical protein